MSLALTILTLLLWVLVGLLSALLGTVLLLVLVPLSLRAEGELGDERTAGSVVVGWGLGLLGVRVSYPEGGALQLFGLTVWRFSLESSDDDKREKKNKKKERKAKKQRKKAKREEDGARGSSLSKGRELYALRSFMWQVVTRLLGTFALRGRAGGQVGTGDPVDTVALRAALLELDRRVDGLELSLEYDFVDELLEVWADVRGRIWLAHTIAALVPFVFKRDAWRLLRAVRA